MGTLVVMECTVRNADIPGNMYIERTYRDATDSDIIKAYNEIIRKRDAERSKGTSMWESINMEEDCAEMPDWEREDDSDHN